MVSQGNTVSTASKGSRALRIVQRARAHIQRVEARCLDEVTAARDVQKHRREALVSRGRALHWSGEPDDAAAVRQLVENAISCAALDAAATALEDARPILLAADGARIHALEGLAAQAGRSARARIEKQIVEIAQHQPDMEDTDAWVRAARLAKGRARSRFAMAAVTTAGRSQSPRSLLAALGVAPETAIDNLACAAAASLAASFASMALGAVPHDSSVLATACEALTPEGARHLAASLADAPATPVGDGAIFHTKARARMLARALPLLPVEEQRTIAARVMELMRDDNYHWLDEQEDEMLVAHLDSPELEMALKQSQHPGAVAPRLAALGRTDEAGVLLEETGGGWYTAAPALRAAAIAPDRLGDLARASIAALDASGRGRLCGELPSAAVRVLGPSETLRFADESGDQTGQYVRIVALARVAEALPEPHRSEAAEWAVRAYHEDPDFDALCELIRCARWMPRHEAAWLLFDSLGRHTTAEPFEHVFIGYAGIGRLSPLIARAAGDPGLLAASEAVVAAEGWA